MTVQVTDAAGQTVSSSTSIPVGSSTTAVNLTSGAGLGLLIGVIVLAVGTVAFAVLWMHARNPRPPRSPPSSASGGP